MKYLNLHPTSTSFKEIASLFSDPGKIMSCFEFNVQGLIKVGLGYVTKENTNVLYTKCFKNSYVG